MQTLAFWVTMMVTKKIKQLLKKPKNFNDCFILSMVLVNNEIFICSAFNKRCK